MKIIRYEHQYTKTGQYIVTSYWSDKSVVRWTFPAKNDDYKTAIRFLEFFNTGERDPNLVRIVVREK